MGSLFSKRRVLASPRRRRIQKVGVLAAGVGGVAVTVAWRHRAVAVTRLDPKMRVERVKVQVPVVGSCLRHSNRHDPREQS